MIPNERLPSSDSVVDTANRLQARQPQDRGSTPRQGRTFFSSAKCPEWFTQPSTQYAARSFPRGLGYDGVNMGFDPRTDRMQDVLHVLVSAPDSHFHAEHLRTSILAYDSDCGGNSRGLSR